MSTKDNKKIKFEFLSDEAVQAIENDKLKHPSIAEALKDIVVSCPFPFTIGLFGKWGTGKSTISNFLENKLKAQENKVAVVNFDVWKYEDDSLRRYFLINLVDKLKEQKFLTADYDLDERVENSTSRSFEGALKISWAKVLQFKLYLLTFLGAVAVGGVLTYLFSTFIFQAYLASVFSIGLTTSAILFLFQVGSEIFTTETKTLSQERLKDAHEFEKEFGKIIENTSTERILIIIDNLDRCTHSKAVEVLSTIKTFLEPRSKKCVFLVQCDDEAIKRHLESVYVKNEKGESNKNIFDADEFLRKFFNTSIKIPSFIDADLEEYTKELLHETEVEVFDSNADLVSVITQAFRENPRQIKQFINTLLSHYLVALERESGNDPVIKLSGAITGNPSFLAKFLIIRQKWPEFYKKLVKSPKSIDDYASEEFDVRIFMGGTNIVKTDNLRAFIYLKQSARRLALPGGVSENLEIAFEDNKGDEVISILKETREKGAKDNQITDFITELIQDNQDSKQNLVNIINLIARSKKELGLDLQATFSEKVAEVIKNNLLTLLYGLELEFVFFVIRASRPELRETITSEYVGILGRAKDAEAVKQIPDYPEVVHKLAGYINSNRDLFTSKKAEVAKALTDAHFDNIDVLTVFDKSKEAIADFISSDLLVKLIESITDADLTTKHSNGESIFNMKFAFLFVCRKASWTIVVEAMLEKLTVLLDAQNKTPETPERNLAIVQIIEKAEAILKDFASQVKDSKKADALTTALLQSSANVNDFSQKGIFLPVFFYLISIVSATEKTSIEQTIQTFAKSSDMPTIKSFIESKDNKFQQDFFQVIKTDLEERAMQDKNFLDLVWSFEDDGSKNVILGKLIDSANYTFALTKLDEESYKTSDSKGVVEHLLNKTLTLSVPERVVIYETVNKMECAKDKDLREKFIDQLKNMVIGQDTASQEIAFNIYNEARKFLPHLIMLPFTVAIIVWLNSLDPVNVNHKFALKIAFLYWDEISDTYKDNLMTIIFDRVIAKTTSVDEINMAFDIIYSTQPKYSKYKPHFDIVLSKAQGEQEPTIKEAIKTGLQKLKPSKVTPKNTFWSEVDKL